MGPAKLKLLAIPAFVAAVLLAGCTQPLAAGERAIDLGKRGSLVLKVPAGWRMEQQEDTGNPLLTLKFTPEVGDEFTVLLTLVAPEIGADPDFGSADSVYRIVAAAAEEALSHAAETELEIRDFEGDRIGYYFWATDRDLVGLNRIPPGQYLHLTQGAVMVGGILCRFTVLTNERPSGVIDAAMMMLRTAEHRRGN